VGIQARSGSEYSKKKLTATIAVTVSHRSVLTCYPVWVVRAVAVWVAEVCLARGCPADRVGSLCHP
jgi:hypothetical protein